MVFAIIIAVSMVACNLSKSDEKNSEKNSTRSPVNEEKLKKITFVLDWTPNTNHTGIYVAQNKGYFKEQGLDVEIIQPADSSSDTMVASGSAQFGISYQESVTFARSQDVPVVSIAAVIQHNTSGFASLKEKNILSPKDFEGKTYGGWGSPIEEATIKYLMDQAGADFSKVNILTTGDADFFQISESGQVDFAWIFEGWDGAAARLRGIELNYIDLGKEAPVFDYYTPVIITNESLINENEELVEAFMKAAVKGYKFAIENPEEAADIFVEAVPEIDKELAIESQKFLADKYQAEAPYWGMQKEETWKNYCDWLFENEFIEKNIDVTKAFTNKYVEK
ncbi:MAG: ABC transporter substrate-binding protein [Clostridiaceae bacterium]|nr:ABC transporter substrate-binding protein [Clostridiaceae bacterium]